MLALELPGTRPYRERCNFCGDAYDLDELELDCRSGHLSCYRCVPIAYRDSVIYRVITLLVTSLVYFISARLYWLSPPSNLALHAVSGGLATITWFGLHRLRPFIRLVI